MFANGFSSGMWLAWVWSVNVDGDSSPWTFQQDYLLRRVIDRALRLDAQIARGFATDLAAKFFEGADDGFMVGTNATVLDSEDHILSVV